MLIVSKLGIFPNILSVSKVVMFANMLIVSVRVITTFLTMVAT